MLLQQINLLKGSLLLELLLIIPSLVIALSTTSTSRSSPTSPQLLPFQHRVFVGGLTTACSQARLKETLQQYGPIQNIFISDETKVEKSRRRPYAFVDFCDQAAAARAIAATASAPESEALYRTIEAATPPNKTPAQKEQERKAHLDYQEKLTMAQTSSAIIQVHDSHINRLEQFLHGRNIHKDVSTTPMMTTGSCRKTSCRSVGLLGVANVDASQLQPWFQSLPFPLRGVNKIYAVDPQQQFTGTALQALQQCVGYMSNLVASNDNESASLWKLNVFPPRLLPKMLEYLQEHHPELESRLSPQNFTHTVNLVHIPTDHDNDYNEHEHVWSMGIEPRGGTPGVESDNKKAEVAKKDRAIISNQANADLICRAQSKLQEAFFRYTRGPLPDCIATEFNSKQTSERNGGIAVDCGAAPGGWTQFMLDHTYCDRIYSIDPGELDPSVTVHSNVVHLRSKAEDAMSHVREALKEENENEASTEQQYAKLWVSDMCLHQMSDQVGIFLNALRTGVVGKGTFVVLTLKCRVGHSDEAFDGQVAVQRERLENKCRDLQTIHLFSNRKGERTIMGFVKGAAT